MEPPIAHMIPEGSGHLLLPVISFIALFTLDWRIALASLVTVPLSMVFMTLTMIISGKSFTQYDESNAHMNSTIVEYIEGIEVIKSFGRAGTSYEKYAKAILDYKKFVVKWLSSTWITMKMTFALFLVKIMLMMRSVNMIFFSFITLITYIFFLSLKYFVVGPGFFLTLCIKCLSASCKFIINLLFCYNQLAIFL